MRTPDYLFGNLETRYLWNEENFLGLMEILPDGISEIGCHPGFCDAPLRAVSSLQEAREKELRLFSNGKMRSRLSELGIHLISFKAF